MQQRQLFTHWRWPLQRTLFEKSVSPLTSPLLALHSRRGDALSPCLLCLLANRIHPDLASLALIKKLSMKIPFSKYILAYMYYAPHTCSQTRWQCTRLVDEQNSRTLHPNYSCTTSDPGWKHHAHPLNLKICHLVIYGMLSGHKKQTYLRHKFCKSFEMRFMRRNSTNLTECVPILNFLMGRQQRENRHHN